MKPINQQNRRISKRMSFWLRHQPADGGLTLDLAGWAGVQSLLEALRKKGAQIDLADLQRIVATNDKKRFEFDSSGDLIRARQGHSIEVELGYPPVEPPGFLFHGTATRNLESIRKRGLHRAGRRHVHLSTNAKNMIEVARRHGKPVLIRVSAGEMHKTGHSFFHTENDVWLTESVPPEFLEVEPGLH
jgi:putative RNA 2'-phosphotransferase